jgi:hypothetical protein
MREVPSWQPEIYDMYYCFWKYHMYAPAVRKSVTSPITNGEKRIILRYSDHQITQLPYYAISAGSHIAWVKAKELAAEYVKYDEFRLLIYKINEEQNNIPAPL